MIQNEGDETDGTYSAVSRLQLLELGEGHEWVVDANGDCWNGWHAAPYCKRCNVDALPTCYHELPYPPGATEQWLQSHAVQVRPGARRPCTG